MCAGVIEADVSDHFPIFVVFGSCAVKSKGMCHGMITFRSYKKYDQKKFQDSLAEVKWDLVFKQNDVNKAYDMFYELFQRICDKHAPILIHRFKKKRNSAKKPWITLGILKSIRRKQKLYSKYKNSNFNPQIGVKYKKYRNVLTLVLKKCKAKLL